jgi:hypothetical protein
MGPTIMADIPKKRSGAGRPAVAEPKRPIASFRGRAEFEAWFEGLKKHSRLAGATLIEHALIEYAERHGYEEAAPER